MCAARDAIDMQQNVRANDATGAMDAPPKRATVAQPRRKECSANWSRRHCSLVLFLSHEVESAERDEGTQAKQNHDLDSVRLDSFVHRSEDSIALSAALHLLVQNVPVSARDANEHSQRGHGKARNESHIEHIMHTCA